MKNRKFINNILIFLTIISPMAAIFTAFKVGEVSIFELAGFVRGLRIMWLFLIFPALLALMGLKLKKDKEEYKVNFITAIICALIIVLFGTYGLNCNGRFLYDSSRIVVVEEKTRIDLPNEVKIATVKMDTYDITYAKIIDQESKENFEKDIKQNSLWKTELSSRICNLLPTNTQFIAKFADYFMFYNMTSGEYNTFPSDGEYEVIFIAYDFKRIMIIDNYTINVN